jgi:hypothetical protein
LTVSSGIASSFCGDSDILLLLPQAFSFFSSPPILSNLSLFSSPTVSGLLQFGKGVQGNPRQGQMGVPLN